MNALFDTSAFNPDPLPTLLTRVRLGRKYPGGRQPARRSRRPPQEVRSACHLSSPHSALPSTQLGHIELEILQPFSREFFVPVSLLPVPAWSIPQFNGQRRPPVATGRAPPAAYPGRLDRRRSLQTPQTHPICVCCSIHSPALD